WAKVAFMIALAITFREHTDWLVAGMLLSAAIYHVFYRYLARRHRSSLPTASAATQDNAAMLTERP
ncbi:hypothetical protein RZS08_02665, partial [Arthrospira platensis SPKY1]|nr:hypothetical protein [Arthrospira platensis SPKY1]